MRSNPVHGELMILSYQFEDFWIHLPCEFNSLVVSWVPWFKDAEDRMCPPKVHTWTPSPQCGGVSRWGP